jgi:hypothetical protein
MGQENIYKITVISPLSELERGLDIICQKYNNPQGHSFIFLNADQFGLNVDNIFDLNEYSSLILASESTIEQFIIIFTTADIKIEYMDFEEKFYNDFDLNTLESNDLKQKFIKHLATKFNCNHTLSKIIFRKKLNEIDYLIFTKKLVS